MIKIRMPAIREIKGDTEMPKTKDDNAIRDFLATKVTRDNGPFTQPRIPLDRAWKPGSGASGLHRSLVYTLTDTHGPPGTAFSNRRTGSAVATRPATTDATNEVL